MCHLVSHHLPQPAIHNALEIGRGPDAASGGQHCSLQPTAGSFHLADLCGRRSRASCGLAGSQDASLVPAGHFQMAVVTVIFGQGTTFVKTGVGTGAMDARLPVFFFSA